jgi:trans-aconitate methyltransferase
MYIRELAETYDDIYSARGRDYAKEAGAVIELIRSRTPGASSLLDAACGTGAHLRYLADSFDRVEGVELSEDMRRTAARRLPDVPIASGDLRDFELGRQFDAVVCLFAISHMTSVAELRAAIVRLAGHVAPGGLLLVEPWWHPDDHSAGHVAADLVREGEDGRTIARVSHSLREGSRVRTEVHCLVAESGSGVRHVRETFSLSLFDRQEYLAAFAAAGLTPEYVDTSPWRTGMIVGTNRP